MLKSNETSDDYRNVYFSNLKILSTTRHDSITDGRLEAIDSVFRDIAKSNTDQAHPCLTEMTPNISTSHNTQDAEVSYSCEDNPEVSPQQLHRDIPILLTIQYTNSDTLIGAVEGFLRENEETVDHIHACQHCASTEVKHLGQIAEISQWRRSLMMQLNLRTKSLV